MSYPTKPGTAQKTYQALASLALIAATLSMPWYVANHDAAVMWKPYAGIVLLTVVIFTLYHQLFGKKQIAD